jgi:hypothetical protein
MNIEAALQQIGQFSDHRSTYRAVGLTEVEQAAKLVESAKKRVRVYSQSGFVPNSYKWRCQIEYVEAVKDDETGAWKFSVGVGSAQRSGGSGSLVVVR